MTQLGDAVGRAILNALPDNTIQIRDVSYDFDVYGKDLKELGQEASRVAMDFYGELNFEIAMNVYPEGKGFRAQVRTVIK